MPPNTNPIFELTLTCKGIQLTDADTTVLTALQTGRANGSRIDDIWISSNDTAVVDLAFYINDGVNDLYIGVISVPIGAGYTTVGRISAIATLSPNLGYLALPAGYILEVACVVTMTTATVCTVVTVGGDY